jgi:hypothetical protein
VPGSGSGLIPRPVVSVVAVVVIGVWGTSQVASIFVDGYQVPEAIHAALMVVLGSLFALRQGKDEPAKSPAAAPPAAAPEAAPPPPAPAEVEAPSRRGVAGTLSVAELQARLAAPPGDGRRADQ